MKKIILIIALSFLLFPNFTHAQEPEDVRSEIDELKDLLEEIMERIEALENSLDSDDSEENDEDVEQTNELSPTLQLEKELNDQDIFVEEVHYIVQDEDLKSLYPDTLVAIATNNTNTDIRDVTYAFVAWDSNGLPLKIKKSFDFSDGDYVNGGIAENVNAAPGQSFGHDYGLSIDSDSIEIHTLKAMIVSYEGFNGEYWENPLVEEFAEIFVGKRLADIEDHEEVIFYR